MEDMKPEDREALILKVSAKLKDMPTDDLQDLAKELGVEDDAPALDLSAPDAAPMKPVVDTSVLTGPINGLKNLLIKKARDNDSKS